VSGRGLTTAMREFMYCDSMESIEAERTQNTVTLPDPRDMCNRQCPANDFLIRVGRFEHVSSQGKESIGRLTYAQY
jgi:hypothetical protein